MVMGAYVGVFRTAYHDHLWIKLPLEFVQKMYIFHILKNPKLTQKTIFVIYNQEQESTYITKLSISSYIVTYLWFGYKNHRNV